MKRKLLLLLSVLLLAALFSACSGEQAETTSPPTPQTVSPAPEDTDPLQDTPAPEPPDEPTPSDTAPEPSGPKYEPIYISEGDMPPLEAWNEPINALMARDFFPDEESFLHFDNKVFWAKEMFDPADLAALRYESYMVFEGSEELTEELIEAGKNPGLGVRSLHEQGITGQGVNVAIIDQNLLLDHPEYAGNVAAYYDSGCEQPEDWGSSHAPAVLSLLAGQTVGTAPGAKVWFAAAPSWEADAAYDADCLNWIIEQNRALPEGEKIRVVSVSGAFDGWENAGQWTEAVAAAEAEGILVLDASENNEEGPVIGPAFGDPDDPEDVTKYRCGYPHADTDYSGERCARTVFAPCSYRTTAQEYAAGIYIYTYWAEAGVSWSIPYAAGVLALGWQVNPELDAQTMMDLLLQSAYVNEEGCHIIDPPAFIELVRATAA